MSGISRYSQHLHRTTDEWMHYKKKTHIRFYIRYVHNTSKSVDVCEASQDFIQLKQIYLENGNAFIHALIWKKGKWLSVTLPETGWVSKFSKEIIRKPPIVSKGVPY